MRGGKKTLELMAFCEAERPVGIQIFGSSIDTMVEAAKIVQSQGADFVDLNFGCPVKKVVCDGGGAAWLRDPVELGKLLSAMKAVLRIPLTIKVRTGWDESTRNVQEVTRVAAESGVAWIAIHGRTRAQGYAGRSDWELIREVAHSSAIPVIGNGDIITASDAKRRIEEGYAHAVMIGRGALKIPGSFARFSGCTRATTTSVRSSSGIWRWLSKKRIAHGLFYPSRSFSLGTLPAIPTVPSFGLGFSPPRISTSCARWPSTISAMWTINLSG